MKFKKSTRRDFIKYASMAAAAVYTGCITNEFVDKFKEEGKDPKNYPVVVIGAGMGGLASALYLSRAGFPVTVLEQHSIPGGYATAFQRGIFNFDVSLHFFSLSEDIYKELGIDNMVKRVPIERTTRAIGKDYDVVVPLSPVDDYIEFLGERYPDEKKGIRDYYNYCSALNDELIRFSEKSETGYVFIPFMFFQYPKMWELRKSTFSDVLDKFFKSTRLKSTIANVCGVIGLPPSQASGFIAAVISGYFAKNKIYYFKNRSQDLTNAFSSVIAKNKGSLIFNETVNKILTEKNRATGVQTESGKTYPASFVVSNASAPATFGKFLSHNTEAQKYMTTLSKYEPSISSFIVWLGLKGNVNTIVKEQEVILCEDEDIETHFQYYLNGNAYRAPLSLVLYDNYFKGYSRPGTSTLTIMMLCGYEPWQQFEKDYFAGNKRDYYRKKEQFAQTLIKRVEKKVIPGLSSMIQVMEAATPLTNMRYTKNPGGAIYGYPASINNAYMNRIKNTTPIEGLYLSSAWGNYYSGYTGGIMNGRDVYRLIMKSI